MAEETTPPAPDDDTPAPEAPEAPTGDRQGAPEEAAAAAEQATPEEPAAAEQAAPAEAATAAEQAGPEEPAATAPDARPKGGKPRRDRSRRQRERQPRRDRGSRQPRSSGPLPFQELRDAATAVVELFGPRQALRDAFVALGDKEKRDLSRLVAEDGDWRVRARNIAAGSLGAGRVGKALAAQQVSMARIEDLWTLTLSKEEAAERQARVRNARRRDERRAQRDAEREQRSDRVSRAELAKAQDGRVGAQVRFVIVGEPREKRRKESGGGDDPPEPEQGSSVLDRLGY
jgi:hypothetical protein